MLEQGYQKKVIDRLEKSGFYVLKLSVTNKNGIPDLMAIKQGHTPLFIEMKGDFGRISAMQKFRIKELRRKGFHAFVYNGKKILY